jgi:hypothetical protein
MTGTRKSLDELIKEELERLRQIRDNVGNLRSKAREQDRKLDTRRKIIIGAAIMSYANDDREFRELLRKVARIKIVRPHDQAVVRDFLFGDASEAGAPDRPENPSATFPARPDPS